MWVPNQERPKAAAPLKAKAAPGCAGEGVGPEPGAAADRRPLEGEVGAGPEPGVAEDRRSVKVKATPDRVGEDVGARTRRGRRPPPP